ncbi:MAG: dihydrolipoamide acetyltransferase family protein [Ilumatobacter sp.]|uniref:dihydrolipoamide acetyltransferase family protein n=1 Tax=Ilumatobacter sp. TaxID=1967498 RepID=UPI0032980A12
MADVTLPQLGETVTEGTITQWFKAVGDTVAEDEPLFEVSTDKVDTEVPSPVSGTLTEIRVQEGDTVEVGTVIAVVGDADGAPADAPAPAAEEAPAPQAEEAPAAAPEPDAAPAPEPPAEAAPAAQPAPEPSPAPAAEQPAPEPTAPAGDNRLLSPVVRRLVNEHSLDPDQITGTGPGGRITRDDVLDHIDASGATKQADAAVPEGGPQASAQQPTDAAAGAVKPDPGSSSPADASSPASEQSTAPAPAAPKPAASAPSVKVGERDSAIRLSKIRQLTGDHMVMSKAVSPHAFSVVEVDFANVDVVRSARKAEWKAQHGFSLTYLPFISRAIIDALGEFPHLNASLSDDQLIVHDYIDLGIAVDLDYEGLLAPVIRDAETKRLGAIASEISDLADRARNRRLAPDEISGGTFTISNNGSAGSVLTMPIINQPQVGIISTDAIVRKPVVIGEGGSEAIAIHPVGNLSMAWDHRAFDGAYAAGFLKKVKELLETKDWAGEL